MAEPTTTPEERAEAAARDLADRGLAVTARAVREEAGVRMAVAATTARAWNQAAKEDRVVTVPETPDDVRSRVDAIWADAYRAALALITPERDRLAAQIGALEGEVEALTTAVAEVEEERDEALAAAEQRVTETRQAQDALQASVAAAQTVRARCEALEGERDRLVVQLDALIKKLPEPAPTKPRSTTTKARSAANKAGTQSKK